MIHRRYGNCDIEIMQGECVGSRPFSFRIYAGGKNNEVSLRPSTGLFGSGVVNAGRSNVKEIRKERKQRQLYAVKASRTNYGGASSEQFELLARVLQT